MNLSFSERASLPTDVLISNVENESVLLNLKTERYFGLDEIGTRFFSFLTSSNDIQTAYEALLEEYDVEPEVLRHDLIELLETLSAQGLITVSKVRS
jgi:hypothetical protein